MPSPSELSPPAADHTLLREQLDTLAVSGRRTLRGWRFHLAFRSAARWALLGLPAFPLLLIFARLLGLGGGAALGWTGVVALTVLGPVLYIFLRVAWEVVPYRPARAAALALHDAQLANMDRLVIADEFLADPGLAAATAEASFKRAAVDDACASARTALATPLAPLPVPALAVHRASAWGVPAALVLLFLGSQAPARRASPPAATSPLAALAPEAPLAAPPAESPAAAPRRAPRPPAPATPEVSDNEAKRQPDTKPARRVARRDQPKDTLPGSSSGNQSSSASSGGAAAGATSGQKSSPPQKKPEARPKEENEDPDGSAPKQNSRKRRDSGQMAMETNSGQGKSSSSSSSMFQLESPEESDKSGRPPKTEAEDEASEDEDENEKSNSVSKPMGDTRQPPVDRNLSTRPPGDQPGGNGRGGPGDIKKTRGVPSMILGIPVPDRVPGSPGPGRSKVSQEFTRPKEEANSSIDALSYLARTGELGHVEQPDLEPWRRALIERYFVQIRQPDADAPAASAGPARTPSAR